MPVLEECVLFFKDFMIEDQGEMVVCPSVSPENTYYQADGTTGSACAGCTMDTGILRDIFHAYLEGNRILGKKASQEDWVHETLDKLPLYKVGKYGQLLEKIMRSGNLGTDIFRIYIPCFRQTRLMNMRIRSW